MQYLVLSPDNKWAAAYTNNNQTVLLNMLSSEFVSIENPMEEGENVVGIYLLNHNLFIYGTDKWVKYDMRGNREDDFNGPLNKDEWPILGKI